MGTIDAAHLSNSLVLFYAKMVFGEHGRVSCR